MGNQISALESSSYLYKMAFSIVRQTAGKALLASSATPQSAVVIAVGNSTNPCRFISTVMMGQFENGRLYGNETVHNTDEYKSMSHVYQKLNMRALKDFHKLHGYFSPINNDVILDFGCGDGQTTAGMAQGELVHEQPRKVIGIDISKDKIESCKRAHGDVTNLAFVSFDSAAATIDKNNVDNERKAFLEKWRSKVSLITAFTSLHQVEDLPKTIHFFSQLLKDGGKLMALIPTQPLFGLHQQESVAKALYEIVRSPKWTKLLGSLQQQRQKGQDKAWMRSSKDHIMAADFQNLLANYGLVTEQLKDVQTRLTMQPCSESSVAEEESGHASAAAELLTDIFLSSPSSPFSQSDDSHRKQLQSELVDDVTKRHQELLRQQSPDPYQYTDVLNMFRIMAIKH